MQHEKRPLQLEPRGWEGGQDSDITGTCNHLMKDRVGKRRGGHGNIIRGEAMHSESLWQDMESGLEKVEWANQLRGFTQAERGNTSDAL